MRLLDFRGRRRKKKKKKKSRPVERREAQRPAGRPRKPAGFLGARVSPAGLASPSGWRAKAEPRKLRYGASQAPGASRRSIAPTCGGTEKGDVGGPGAQKKSNNTGGEALAFY